MLTKEFLEEEYVKNKKSSVEVAKIAGCSAPTIRKYVKKFGLPYRTHIDIFPIEDLIGKEYNNWTVEKYYGVDRHSKRCWICKCKCGRIGVISTTKLINNKVNMCSNCNKNFNKGKNHKLRKGYEDISGHFWHKIIESARLRKLDFNITIHYVWDLYLKQNKKCAISGLEINFPQTTRESDRSQWTASLDRINTLKGYTEDNVQWVHKHVNFMKQNFDQDYFIKLCKIISNNNIYE